MSNINLFIASEVRSGSTYIAESISYSLSESYNTSFWDASKELFNELNDNSADAHIWELLSSISCNSFGIRSAKIMCAALSIINRQAKHSPDLHEEFFGQNAKWIIVRRKNKIRQAISLATAISSNTWHFYGEPASSPDNQTVLTNSAIYDALKMIILSDEYLENFSRVVNNSITIYYEDFVDAESDVLVNILQKLKLPFDTASLNFIRPKLKQTADSLKTDAEKSFREYFLENYHKVET